MVCKIIVTTHAISDEVVSYFRRISRRYEAQGARMELLNIPDGWTAIFHHHKLCASIQRNSTPLQNGRHTILPFESFQASWFVRLVTIIAHLVLIFFKIYIQPSLNREENPFPLSSSISMILCEIKCKICNWIIILHFSLKLTSKIVSKFQWG